MRRDLPRTDAFAATVRFAFSDSLAVISVIVSAFALINLVVRLLDLGLSQVLMSALLWYREIIHGLFDYILWFLPFRLPQITKDLITLWVLLGGLIARTNIFLRLSEMEIKGKQAFLPQAVVARSEVIGRRDNLPKFFQVALLIFRTLLLWPWELAMQFYVPYVYWTHTIGVYYRTRSHDSSLIAPGDQYRFDLRHVVLAYAIALVGASAVFFACNALLPSVR